MRNNILIGLVALLLLAVYISMGTCSRESNSESTLPIDGMMLAVEVDADSLRTAILSGYHRRGNTELWVDTVGGEFVIRYHNGYAILDHAAENESWRTRRENEQLLAPGVVVSDADGRHSITLPRRGNRVLCPSYILVEVLKQR